MTEQSFDVAPPTEAKVGKAARELVRLVESHLPQRFYPSEHYTREFCAASIVRMADTVEAVLALMEAGLPDDGLVLLRTFYEMVARFLWVSVDPPRHTVSWGNEARRQSLILHKELATHGHTLLNEGQIERATGAKAMPKLIDLVDVVDKHWGGRMIGFSKLSTDGGGDMLSMRGMYTFVYRPGSAMAHMQPETLERYSTWEPSSRSLVQRPSKDEPSVWWPIVVSLYAHALIACHDRLNWPSPARVRAINNAMYE